ncbi:ATP-dependent permease [Stygiomarasmius scandens]|uniref:ATP-dependent permease n=2 Tax=Marasmiellus scandens TaxID=2682957 RepID=A0ABR1JLV5_9AGAR
MPFDLRLPLHLVTFSSTSFSYPTHPDVPVLSSCDLSIYPGECVAVVGPSGCGKSTIASLLQRLYKPKSGSILLGGPTGVDIDMMDVSWLRKHLTVVSQTPTLFDMTIAENIAYGLKGGVEAHYHNIRRAAKLANVHEWIMDLPEGYETPIGEKASEISGGQAQRLMIARALARKNARVMVLDECTSALDVENQRKVVKTLVGLKEGGVGEERQKMTMVMITHKVPVMRMCDRILVLDDYSCLLDWTLWFQLPQLSMIWASELLTTGSLGMVICGVGGADP